MSRTFFAAVTYFHQTISVSKYQEFVLHYPKEIWNGNKIKLEAWYIIMIHFQCNTISAIFYNINFQNLAVMNHDDSIKKSSFNLELLKVNESSLDSFALVLAKNYTGNWYVNKVYLLFNYNFLFQIFGMLTLLAGFNSY